MLDQGLARHMQDLLILAPRQEAICKPSKRYTYFGIEITVFCAILDTFSPNAKRTAGYLPPTKKGLPAFYTGSPLICRRKCTQNYATLNKIRMIYPIPSVTPEPFYSLF